MGNSTERLIRIYNRLRRGPITIETVSNWARTAGINISKRQLYRDLSCLHTLKIAQGENVIEFIDEKNRKTWKLEYDDSVDTINQFDINSFLLFRNFIPSSISKYRNSSLEKFEKILYRNLSKNKFQNTTETNELHLKKTDWYDNKYGKAEHTKIEDLIWALQNKRNIQINISEINPSFVNLKKFSYPIKVHPIELLFHRGRIHIACVKTQSHKLIIYTIDESLKFELTNELFNRRKLMQQYNDQIDLRFGISEPESNKVYNIQIEYSTDYALSMKNFNWHKTASWKVLKNGNYMLHMRCCVNRELIGFIAQGLDKVKIHNPKKLKDLLLIKYQESINVHRGLSPNESRSNYGY